MMNKKMVEALNKQINEELFSSYLYLQMSAWFKQQNLDGFATWMRVQAKEELVHAMKFYDFVIERGETALLLPIAGPQKAWKSPLDAFEAAYKHELHITSCIHGLVDLARKLKDHAAESFLLWYVNEQVEEEANADGIVRKLRLMKDAPGGLYMLDRELATRVFAIAAGAESVLM